MALAAGKLRHRIQVQNPVVITNDVGQDEYTYTSLGADDTWALVEFVNERKGTAGAVQAAGSALFEITMRHRTDITYRTRLIWQTRTLQVTGISKDPLDVVMTLEAEEAEL